MSMQLMSALAAAGLAGGVMLALLVRWTGGDARRYHRLLALTTVLTFCLVVVGAYVRLDRRGVGHCPWPEHHAHEDRAPSFQVLSRAQRWTCYATGESGNAFDFVCRMEGLRPKEALAYCREHWPADTRDEPTR